ncbi:mitochondrial splicing system protein [Coemansia sp. BCRC 34301]|nr:mitochondrial splicing system protein [Coemansia sp. BCRC 34301]
MNMPCLARRLVARSAHYSQRAAVTLKRSHVPHSVWLRHRSGIAPQSDTIFALSTHPGKAALGIVRITGADTRRALQLLLPTKMGASGLTARRQTLRQIVDPSTGEILDTGVCVWIPGPRSFTGEDMAELHVHGGTAVIAGVLRALGAMTGLRMAEAGEFSRRAFDNDKMDLTAIEGVADLINAETDAQRRLAVRQAGGELAELYETWRTQLVMLMANIEAVIDFGEEENIEDGVADGVHSHVEVLRKEIAAHLDDGRRGEILRSGVALAIVGPPNSGKSTLLNRLAQRQVAIVSPVAGTTRDVIETTLDIGGYPVVVRDTAGLRHTPADTIEVEGIRRALSAAQTADMRICLFDATQVQSQLADDTSEWQDLLSLPHTLVVLNKADQMVCGEVRKRVLAQTGAALVSCKTMEGWDDLMRLVAGHIRESWVEDGEGSLRMPLTKERHRQCLRQCIDRLDRFAQTGGHYVLAAEELRAASTALGRITGRVGIEDIQERIKERLFNVRNEDSQERAPRDEEIKSAMITLISSEGVVQGTQPLARVLHEMDRKQDTLVLVDGHQDPPACRIFSRKLIYERERMARKAAQKTAPRPQTIVMGESIETRDLHIKVEKVKAMLAKGKRVTVVVESLVIQPVVGRISDRCQSRLGRRRPFIIGGAVFVVTSVIAIAYARELATVAAHFLFPNSDDIQAFVSRAAIALVVGGFYVLDFSINTSQACARALALDQAPLEQQDAANAWAGRMLSLGSVAGYLVGFLDLRTLVPWHSESQMQALCLIATIVFTLTVTWTCLMVKEEPQLSSEREEEEEEREEKGWTVLAIGRAVTRLPAPVQRVCTVQFFAWVAWFPFLFFATTWVTEIMARTGDVTDPEFIDRATRAGSFALFLYATASLLCSLALPRVAESVGLRQLWRVSLAAMGVTLLMTWTVDGVPGATLLIVAMAFPWALAMWAPFALVGEYVAIQAESGVSSESGMILGIHNMYVVFPQFFINGVSSLVFAWLGRKDSESGSVEPVGFVLRIGGASALVAAALTMFLFDRQGVRDYVLGRR